MGRSTIFIFGIILGVIFLSNIAYSEVVVNTEDLICLKNGDKLSGKFIADDGKLVTLFYDSKNIYISREEIFSLHTESIVICYFITGEVISGRISNEKSKDTNKDPQHFITSDILGPISINWSKLHHIDSLEQQPFETTQDNRYSRSLISSQNDIKQPIASGLSPKDLFEIEAKEKSGNYFLLTPFYLTDSIGDGFVSNITDSFGLNLGAGIKLYNNYQLNFFLPISIDINKAASFVGDKTSTSTFNKGNLVVGISNNLFEQNGIRPAISMGINASIPLDVPANVEKVQPYSSSEFFSFGLDANFIYSVENTKIFVSISVSKPVSRVIQNTKVSPGITASNSLGFAYPVSDSIFLSTSVSSAKIYPTSYDGNDYEMIEKSQSFLRQDIFLKLLPSTILRPFAIVGISNDAPDLKIGLDFVQSW
jgi:hypothetical protein